MTRQEGEGGRECSALLSCLRTAFILLAQHSKISNQTSHITTQAYCYHSTQDLSLAAPANTKRVARHGILSSRNRVNRIAQGTRYVPHPLYQTNRLTTSPTAATLRAHLAQLTTISNASQQQQQQPSRRAAPSAPSAALNTSLSASLAAPIHSSVNAKLAHTLPGTQPLVAELNEATAWARRYRITGRSCFGVELARGKRAKEEIKEREKGKGKEREGDREREFVKKGVAVRLETFYAGESNWLQTPGSER